MHRNIRLISMLCLKYRNGGGAYKVNIMWNKTYLQWWSMAFQFLNHSHPLCNVISYHLKRSKFLRCHNNCFNLIPLNYTFRNIIIFSKCNHKENVIKFRNWHTTAKTHIVNISFLIPFSSPVYRQKHHLP